MAVLLSIGPCETWHLAFERLSPKRYTMLTDTFDIVEGIAMTLQQ
jgi:hypothetical protein